MDNETKITVLIVVIVLLYMCAFILIVSFNTLQNQYKAYIKELGKYSVLLELRIKMYEDYVDKMEGN